MQVIHWDWWQVQRGFWSGRPSPAYRTTANLVAGAVLRAVADDKDGLWGMWFIGIYWKCVFFKDMRFYIP